MKFGKFKDPLSKYIVDDNGCWLWQGALTWNGYGELIVNYKKRRAHRIVYELLRGPIPSGLTIDHLCRVKRCVNPDHLEPVTLAENVRRGNHDQAKKTHCKHGHELSGDNLLLVSERGSNRRRCLQCKRRTALAYVRKMKALREAA